MESERAGAMDVGAVWASRTLLPLLGTEFATARSYPTKLLIYRAGYDTRRVGLRWITFCWQPADTRLAKVLRSVLTASCTCLHELEQVGSHSGPGTVFSDIFSFEWWFVQVPVLPRTMALAPFRLSWATTDAFTITSSPCSLKVTIKEPWVLYRLMQSTSKLVCEVSALYGLSTWAQLDPWQQKCRHRRY